MPSKIDSTRSHTELSSGFATGTLVATREGLKPIQNVCVGDWVLSYPDDLVVPKRRRKGEEYCYRQVSRILVHEAMPVNEVTVFNFASNLEEVIKVTLNQPFFVERIGWMPASALSFRCPLVADNFGNLATAAPECKDECATVYGLEVDDLHTYYVGRTGVWVHD